MRLVRRYWWNAFRWALLLFTLLSVFFESHWLKVVAVAIATLTWLSVAQWEKTSKGWLSTLRQVFSWIVAILACLTASRLATYTFSDSSTVSLSEYRYAAIFFVVVTGIYYSIPDKTEATNPSFEEPKSDQPSFGDPEEDEEEEGDFDGE